MGQQIINAVVFGSVLTLFSLGLSLAWGTLDVLNMAHGAVFVFSAFLTYEFTKDGQMSFLPALIVSAIGAGLVTTALELVAFRHIRNRFKVKRQAEMSMLVASIGGATILNAIVSQHTEAASFGPPADLVKVHAYHVAGIEITNVQIAIVIVALLAAIGLDLWIRRSRQGRAVRAIAFDPGTSELLGVNVNLLAAATMFVAGALAGLAGVLLAINLGGMDVKVGEDYLLTAFAILIVGGVGSIRGAVSAAYLIAIAQTAVVAYGPAQWRDGIAFLLILVVLLVRPQGLFARGRFQRS